MGFAECANAEGQIYNYEGGNMDRTLSLPVQEFIRACERIMQFGSNHSGLTEDDCHAVIFHATAIIGDLGAHCAEFHQHNDGQKRAA